MSSLKSMMQWPNRRHQRALSLTHEVMRVIGPYLDELDDWRTREAHQADEDSTARPHREVMDKLLEILMATGIEIITDRDREQCGLPARGPDGWTLEELVALEKVRLDVMTRPPPMFIVDRDKVSKISK